MAKHAAELCRGAVDAATDRPTINLLLNHALDIQSATARIDQYVMICVLWLSVVVCIWDKETPLHGAASNGRLSVVQCLAAQRAVASTASLLAANTRS